jgi:CO/xanthine dehydrogenase FAD-binding subunit
MRLARPKHVVDVNAIRELDYVRAAPDGGLEIGALTRHRTLQYSPIVAGHAPLLAEAAPHIGDRQVRYRGTLGGSLAHADPAAELPTVAVILEANLVVAGSRGQRTIPADDFFVTYLTTQLDPDELLVEVRLPPPPPRAGQAFVEFARRDGDYAIVSAAVLLSAENGRITHARVCLGAVAPTPVRARKAEECLIGKVPAPALFAEAGRLAVECTDPPGDVNGSPEYRRKIAAVYVERALESAWHRASAQDVEVQR